MDSYWFWNWVKEFFFDKITKKAVYSVNACLQQIVLNSFFFLGEFFFLIFAQQNEKPKFNPNRKHLIIFKSFIVCTIILFYLFCPYIFFSKYQNSKLQIKTSLINNIWYSHIWIDFFPQNTYTLCAVWIN